MRQSKLFTKTQKEAPKDEVSKNAQLLIRAGYIHKEMAGVYALLPLGVRVMNNIANVVRNEMNGVGGVEVSLTALQDKSVWEKTDRWRDEAIDIWFKSKLKNGTEVGLGFTHEEPFTEMIAEQVNSYRDLPILAYQIQTKFRNELRAKSGIMRGREFLMKDLYSFSRTQKEHEEIYAKIAEAYQRIFDTVGVGDKTYYTYASGGSFSKFSHEFQTLTESGEDTIYVHEEEKIAVNEEIINEPSVRNQFNLEDFIPQKAVEVGNIFSLGTKFSEPLNLTYTDESGNSQPVIMGSYGIGIGRLMGIVAELLSDDVGLIWPITIAPFKVHLVQLGDDDSVKSEAESLYQALVASGVTVLYDDRSLSAGEKFAESDLLGIPFRVVVSKKTLADAVCELKDRKTGSVSRIEKDALIKEMKKYA
ncbi:MAG: aminoacyl--tRNA ligase-related protein [Candidatus Paceibacterota bacterium]